jgi:hypothetical protein
MELKADKPGKGGSSSGAPAALAGFAYQLNVSIFVALDLLLIQKSARVVTLEPANSEDIESILDEGQPDTTEAHSTMSEGYNLIIQVKRRSGEPWRPADFIRLLNHGKSRDSARKTLELQRNRYLLITTAAVRGTLRSLRIEDFGAWPEPGSLEGDLISALGDSVDTRVAIWESLSDYVLDHKIGDIFTKLRVPYARWDDCKRALREEASSRMQGTGAGRWLRSEMETLIRAFGGFLASSPLLEHYVRPGNWSELTAKLEQSNALLIKGPSGTGKTVTALALCEWARERNPRLAIETSSDINRLSPFNLSGPTLFYVDDPWGQSTLRPGSETFGEQAQAAFSDARPDCRYIVTSRTDMLKLGKPKQRWMTGRSRLTGDYEEGQLAAIYDRHLNALAVQYQEDAYKFRPTALSRLKTPFEVKRFSARSPKAQEQSRAPGSICRMRSTLLTAMRSKAS